MTLSFVSCEKEEQRPQIAFDVPYQIPGYTIKWHLDNNVCQCRIKSPSDTYWKFGIEYNIRCHDFMIEPKGYEGKGY